MLKDIVAVKALGDYRLHICFEDGPEGVVDLAPRLSFQGVFEPLRDPSGVNQVNGAAFPRGYLSRRRKQSHDDRRHGIPGWWTLHALPKCGGVSRLVCRGGA